MKNVIIEFYIADVTVSFSVYNSKCKIKSKAKPKTSPVSIKFYLNFKLVQVVKVTFKLCCKADFQELHIAHRDKTTLTLTSGGNNINYMKFII